MSETNCAFIPRPRPTRCRSCGARIVWLKTKTGKSMPVDAPSTNQDDLEYDHERHVSHFGTCPDAKRWSKKKKHPTPI